MRSRRRKVEVAWTRTRSSDADAPRQAIRIRDGRGDWREVESLDELPANVREMIDGLMSGEIPTEDLPAGNVRLEDLPNDTSSIDNLMGVVRHYRVRPPRRHRRRRVRKSESGDSLRLEYVWYEGCTVIAAAITVVALLYYVVEDFVSSAGSHSTFELVMDCGLLFFCFAMAYFGLATLLNRTVITIANGRLGVRHGPLPWPGNRDLAIDEIEQLYCSVYRGGKYDGLRWRLQAVTGLVGSVTLLDHIRSKSEAVDLELAIERHLGIPDWPRYGD